MSAGRHRAEGVLILLTAIVLMIGLFGHLVPDQFQALAFNLRLLDNLRPHLLGAALLGAGLLARLGLTRIALACSLAALAGGLWIIGEHRARIAPPMAAVEETVLRVLWFNLQQDNTVDPDILEEALRASGADLVVLAEARAASGIAPGLADLYPHRAGCTEPDRCGLLILSRFPLGPVTLGDLPLGPERLARFPLLLPEGGAAIIVAAHRLKPWYIDLTGRGDAWLEAVLSGPRERPLIVMGDFNAAPWSRRMGQMVGEAGLHPAPLPVATWPARAGRLGLPIDHVLTRGPLRLQALAPWGDGLGSNHRGLLARIVLAPGDADRG